MILGDDDTIDSNCVALLSQNKDLVESKNCKVIGYATSSNRSERWHYRGYIRILSMRIEMILMRKFRGGSFFVE
jgi:hypothetical protein